MSSLIQLETHNLQFCRSEALKVMKNVLENKEMMVTSPLQSVQILLEESRLSRLLQSEEILKDGSRSSQQCITLALDILVQKKLNFSVQNNHDNFRVLFSQKNPKRKALLKV